MELTLHEPVSHAQQAVQRARKQAKRTGKRTRGLATDMVDDARAIDVHDVAQAATAATTKAAKLVAKRHAKQKSRSAARGVTRIGIAALVVGALVAITVVVLRRTRSIPSAEFMTPDPYGVAVTNASRQRTPEQRTDNGSRVSASSRTEGALPAS